GDGPAPTRIPAEAGLNRFVWDMRHADAARFPGMILWAGEVRGPRVVPGAYQLRLTAGGQTVTETFEVKKDPRIGTTPADFAKQLDLLMKIRDKLTETHHAITRIRDVRRQMDDLLKRAGGGQDSRAVADAAKPLSEKLTAIEETLYQTKNQSTQDPLNYPIRLNNKLAALAGVVASADAAPTDQAHALYEELAGRIDAELKKLEQVTRTDLVAFNKLVRDQNIPAVVIRNAPGGSQ
ncbi:MAG: glycosyl hydrolase, partial [Pyrinomonadaceae bacterium]